MIYNVSVHKTIHKMFYFTTLIILNIKKINILLMFVYCQLFSKLYYCIRINYKFKIFINKLL